MNHIYTIAPQFKKDGLAHGWIMPTKEYRDPNDGRLLKDWLPGEITFKWRSEAKKRPDYVNITAYYPIVSNRVKNFVEASNFSGVGFYRARELGAEDHNVESSDSTDIWWVMYPTYRVCIDTNLFCGPHITICPATRHFILSKENLSGSMPGLIHPVEDIKTDFFGIKDFPWYCCIFFNQKTAELLAAQKFTYLSTTIVQSS
jgi:hypothetical protein